MADPAANIFDPEKKQDEYLERAVAALASAGVRLAFPGSVHEAQVRWPENCPLSSEELRGELRSLQAEVDALSKRAQAVHDRLPEPPEFRHDDLDDAPESLFCTHYNALSYLFEEGLGNSSQVIEDALAATPEGIRRSWLERRLSDKKLERLIPREAGGG